MINRYRHIFRMSKSSLHVLDALPLPAFTLPTGKRIKSNASSNLHRLFDECLFTINKLTETPFNKSTVANLYSVFFLCKLFLSFLVNMNFFFTCSQTKRAR